MQDLAFRLSANIGEGLLLLFARYKVWCQANHKGVFFKPFQPGLIGYAVHDYPCIQDYVKGAHCRQLLAFLSDESVNVASNGEDTSRYAQLRGAMMFHFREHWNIVQHADQFFTNAEALAARRHGELYLQYYQVLAAWSFDEGF